MFSHIMVPVDLHMTEPVSKALDVAVDMARTYGARVTLVNVTGDMVTAAPHGEAQAADALGQVAERLADKAGIAVHTKVVFSHDVPAEVNAILRETAETLGADLVVVGSHAPRFMDYLFSSHAGSLASHSSVSVFVVR
ncbi:MAG: universal stress protein [Rhodobacteraceae bacterium]|nr:universal stress protein [Paracoccaceae bacterium]